MLKFVASAGLQVISKLSMTIGSFSLIDALKHIGSHSDVSSPSSLLGVSLISMWQIGGGYEQHDLSDITLTWMVVC